MDKEVVIKCAKSILLAIEDERYPARRTIYDDVVNMVAEFDFELSKELDGLGREFFDNKDKQLTERRV